MLETELAAEQADRQSLIGKANPSGGFHKRHLVGLLIPFLHISYRQSALLAFTVSVFAINSAV